MEMLLGLLFLLAVPTWLVTEQILLWRRRDREARHPAEANRPLHQPEAPTGRLKRWRIG